MRSRIAYVAYGKAGLQILRFDEAEGPEEIGHYPRADEQQDVRGVEVAGRKGRSILLPAPARLSPKEIAMQTPHPASTSPRSKALTRFTFVLAGALVLVLGFTLWMFFTEGQRPASAHPLVLPGAPSGTYAQNTQLGLSTMAVAWGLAAVGAVLAFRWRRPAACLLIASSVIQAFLFVLGLNDPTRPREKPWGPLFVFVLPPVVLAALLLRATRRGVTVR